MKRKVKEMKSKVKDGQTDKRMHTTVVIIYKILRSNGHGQTYNIHVDTLNSSFNVICVIMLISFSTTILKFG
jgi:hypothetical protein